MKKLASMSQAEVAAYIQTGLRKKKIETVLTGGATVAIYSDGKYVTADIDLVDEGFASMKEISEAMGEMGFKKRGMYFEHKDTNHIIQHVGSPPPSVGSEPVKEIHELRLPTGTLRLLSPTDCVKDRLAAYYYFDDRQTLEQAILVTRARSVDLAEVQRWSEAEGMGEKYWDFVERLEE